MTVWFAFLIVDFFVYIYIPYSYRIKFHPLVRYLPGGGCYIAFCRSQEKDEK